MPVVLKFHKEMVSGIMLVLATTDCRNSKVDFRWQGMDRSLVERRLKKGCERTFLDNCLILR